MTSNVVSIDQLVPFDSDLFVDRTKAIQLFFETIRAKTDRRYLEFTGVAGQGKTELLKHLCHKAREEGYFPAYIDFEWADYHRSEIYPVLQRIAKCLAIQISPDLFHAFQERLALYLEELGKIYRESQQNVPADTQSTLQELETQVVNVFNENLQFALRTHTIILFLDSTEKAYRPTLFNFEEQVLKHHIKSPNFILVTAGQELFVWKNTSIKNRIKRYTLRRFEREAVDEQLQKLSRKKEFHVEDNDLIADQILCLTLGHPFSSYILIDFWTDGFKGHLNNTVVEDRFEQSISKLSKQVIEDRILGKFQLSEEYPPVEQVLRYLVPLRRIEMSTFQYVLNTFGGELFEGKPFSFFQKLIGEFQRTYIFHCQVGGEYDIDSVVRNILLWDMRTNKLKLFLEMQEKLEQRYNERVAKTHEATQVKNMVERLYHYAMYVLKTEPNYLNAKVQTEVQQYLDTYFTVEFVGDEMALYDQLNRFYNTLEHDKELKNLIDITALLEKIDHKRSTIE